MIYTSPTFYISPIVAAIMPTPKIIDIDTSEAEKPAWGASSDHHSRSGRSGQSPSRQIAHEKLSTPTLTILANEKVRFVGEPVVAVVAEDRYIAEDAAALVMIDYEPLAN